MKHKYLPIKIEKPLLKEIVITLLIVALFFGLIALMPDERGTTYADTTYAGTTYADHVVKPGDTIWDIAKERYPGQHTGEKVYQITEANKVQNGLIKPGQVLKVPDK